MLKEVLYLTSRKNSMFSLFYSLLLRFLVQFMTFIDIWLDLVFKSTKMFMFVFNFSMKWKIILLLFFLYFYILELFQPSIQVSHLYSTLLASFV